MKLYTLALVSLMTTSAFAQSNYEKIKALYDNAKTPASVDAVIAKLPAIKACAKVNAKSETSSEKLVLVRHTIPGAGPEIPDVTLRGLGFSGADERPVLFFESYKQVLNAQGLAISYSYTYSYRECWGVAPDRECDTYPSTEAGSGIIRLSDKYILFAKAPEYGYCWF